MSSAAAISNTSLACFSWAGLGGPGPFRWPQVQRAALPGPVRPLSAPAGARLPRGVGPGAAVTERGNGDRGVSAGQEVAVWSRCGHRMWLPLDSGRTARQRTLRSDRAEGVSRVSPSASAQLVRRRHELPPLRSGSDRPAPRRPRGRDGQRQPQRPRGPAVGVHAARRCARRVHRHHLPAPAGRHQKRTTAVSQRSASQRRDLGPRPTGSSSSQ